MVVNSVFVRGLKRHIIIKSVLTAVILIAAGFIFFGNSVQAKKNYTITPKSELLNYQGSPSLNKYTRHYFLLRTHLEAIEAAGGGTLTLKKGTYKISNSVCIPSNTKIILKDGVKLVKINKTGKALFKPAQAMFHVVSPKIFNNGKKVKGYKGTKNSSIIGQGNATIDLKGIKNAKGLVVGHTKNFTIKNIHFKNMNTGHFVEVDASTGTKIIGCTFSGVSSDTPWNKEAINIDTPDALTGGLNVPWTSHDCTPNKNLLIEGCTFENLNRGIGTHKYSQKKSGGAWVNCMHEGITISGNTFTNISDTAIFMMNWKDTTVTGNTFNDVTKAALDFRGVKALLTVKGNILNNTAIAPDHILSPAYEYSNNGDRSNYPPITNDFGYEDAEQLLAANNS